MDLDDLVASCLHQRAALGDVQGLPDGMAVSSGPGAGGERTRLTIMRDGSGLRVAMGSTYTSPVKVSAAPFAVGSFGSISMGAS